MGYMHGQFQERLRYRSRALRAGARRVDILMSLEKYRVVEDAGLRQELRALPSAVDASSRTRLVEGRS